MTFIRYIAALLLVGLASGIAAQEGGQGEVPRGVWQTEPDSLGVVLLVRTRACGSALCARVQRAKNRAGYDAPSDAVGQKVFWAMKPQPDGSFFGEYRDARAQRFLQSRVEVFGRKLRLRACDKTACRETTWKLVR
jgi:hypothetical protein